MKAIYEPKGKAREYAELALNLRQGCEHRCLYCYCPRVLHMSPEDFHAHSKPRPNVLETLRKEAPRYTDSKEPVLMCFSCDPYSPTEGHDMTTRTALGILQCYDVPVHILTKGGMRASRDFDLLTRRGCAFGTTLVFTDDADRLRWEPGAAPIADRIEAIKLAHSLGIRTWVSVEPVVEPAQAIEVIEMLTPWVDEFRVGKLNYHEHAKQFNWHYWAAQLLKALQASGRDYLVKESLRAYLPEDTSISGSTCMRGTAM